MLAVLVNCTKNHSIDNLNSDKDQIQNDNELILKIHKFQELAKQQRNGIILKSGKKTSIDSALFYIDATFNYTYCFSTNVYNKIHRDTTYTCFPNDQNEEVLFDDVVTAYNKSVDGVRLKYRSVSDTSKKLVAVVFEDLGTDANNYRQVMVISQIGTGTSLGSILGTSRNFDIEDEYWFLRDSWMCNESNYGIGAPNVLQNETNFIFRPAPPPNVHVWFSALEIFEPNYLNYSVGNTIDNYCDYHIFYANSSIGSLQCLPPDYNNCARCLDYNQGNSGIHEMDFYLDGTSYVIFDWLNDVIKNPYNKSFKSISIYSYDEFNQQTGVEQIGHNLSITFGKRHESVIVPAQYPINIY